ncbi:NUDIX hydrolase [Streptomyces graminifolii]|uniref:NUDIX hydrolase n=1 Tax=Streptomyces graminifolii TaxID=1266771 RepID=UPI00405A3AFA
MTYPASDKLVRDLMHQAESDGIDALFASILLSHHGRVLLIKHSPTTRDFDQTSPWDLPTCSLEPDETPLDAMDRAAASTDNGISIEDVTGYLGSYDRNQADGNPSRTFVFTAATADPTPICEAGRLVH